MAFSKAATRIVRFHIGRGAAICRWQLAMHITDV